LGLSTSPVRVTDQAFAPTVIEVSDLRAGEDLSTCRARARLVRTLPLLASGGIARSLEAAVEGNNAGNVAIGDGVSHELGTDASAIVVGSGKPVSEARISVSLPPTWHLLVERPLNFS
jgi:hypothetical protein